MNNSMFGDEFSGDAILGQNNNGMNDSFNQAGGMNYTPAKQNQVPQEPCLLPCTIKQILNAPNPQQDEPFYIDGRDTTKDNVTIVGRTIRVDNQSTHRTFTIDDGTGQLDVKFWSAAENDSNPQEEIPDNTYVRCIGKLYGSTHTRNMTGYDIRKITDFDEITYHHLDVINTHLINTMPQAAKQKLQNIQKQKLNFNGNKNNDNNNSNINRSNSNNSYNNNNNSNNSNSNNGMNNSFAFGNNNNSNNNGGNAGMNTSMMSSAGNNNNNNGNNGGNNNNNSMMVDNNSEDHPPLHRKILAMLERVMNQHQNDENYQGCHVDTIFDQLRDEDRNQIREALEQMSSDGHIFSTIDDETYNISQ